MYEDKQRIKELEELVHTMHQIILKVYSEAPLPTKLDLLIEDFLIDYNGG